MKPNPYDSPQEIVRAELVTTPKVFRWEAFVVAFGCQVACVPVFAVVLQSAFGIALNTELLYIVVAMVVSTLLCAASVRVMF